MRDFNGKAAVITGGASGVGRALAFALGRRGAKIAVGDVDKAAMAQVRADLAAENIAAIVEFCDVTSVESLNALADKAESAFDNIDLVFADAGVGAGESGIELKTTHPDEVAEMAVAGLQNDAFWLLATTPETEAKIRSRANMILNRETPVPNMVGA